MDHQRASDAIEAFRTAEDAINQLISNAGELTESAESIRDTDQSVKSLAEALGLASKQWVEIATELKNVTAEIQAAGKLLQKAEPQELMNAIDESTVSIGELRAEISTLATFTSAIDDQLKLLTSHVESVAETSTNLREALIAKMDLQQSSLTQLQTDVDRLEGDLADRAKQMETAQSDSRDQILKATQRTLYAASAAAVFALVAVVLAVVI